MTARISGGRAFALSSLFLLMLSAGARPALAAKCSGDPEDYDGKYTVRRVRIDAPLGWLFASVRNVTKNILQDKEMPLKEGKTFVKQNFDDGFIFVRKKFQELQTNPEARFTTRVAYPDIENCDTGKQGLTGKPELDVVYRVYTISFSNTLMRTFEVGAKEEVNRGVPDTTAPRRLARYFFQPYAGYNRSRGGALGGTKFTARVDSKLIKTLSLDAAGAGSGSEVRFDATGSREREQGPVRYVEWDFEYFHTDVPSDVVDLARATGRGQIIAATRPFGARELILRFGAAVEGGNRQTDLTGSGLTAEDIADSGHRALKLFAGGSMTWGRHTFKASYGAQLGNAGEGFGVDYVKQVFDADGDLWFTPGDPHYPITFQTRFAAGDINIRRRLPVAERFFGGNTEQSFISGDTWVIQSNPLIRSFPQNRFNRTGAGGVVGGERFFSLNTTLAVTVWAEPMVPREIEDYCARPQTNEEGEPEEDNCLTLDDAVAFSLSGAESAIKSAYVSDTPEFKALSERVKDLERPLSELNDELLIVGRNPDPQVREVYRRLFVPPANDLPAEGSYTQVVLGTTSILKGLKNDTVNRSDVRALVVGVVRTNKPSRIVAMGTDLEALEALLPGDQGVRLAALRRKFLDIGKEIKTNFEKLIYSDVEKQTPSEIDKQAEEKAKQEMVFPRRVINRLIHESNLYSASPVAYFDAARLWQGRGLRGDMRYGVGGGARFTFVGLDVTGGYVWNIDRRPNEGRGAFVFGFELSNLFK
jgi:hypothetical protein